MRGTALQQRGLFCAPRYRRKLTQSPNQKQHKELRVRLQPGNAAYSTYTGRSEGVTWLFQGFDLAFSVPDRLLEDTVNDMSRPRALTLLPIPTSQTCTIMFID